MIPENGNVGRSIPDVSSDFLDFYSKIQPNGFDEAFNQSLNTAGESKIVKVSDLLYRVEKVKERHDYKSENNQERNKNTNQTDAHQSKESDNNQIEQPLYSPIQLNFIPESRIHFMTKLPHNLSNFLESFVTVVKQYHSSKGYSDNIRVKFKDFNIDVLFSYHKESDTIKIKLFLGDNSLHDEFTEENQKILLSRVREEIDQNIDFSVEFLAYNEQFDQNSSDSQDSEDDHQSEQDQKNEDLSVNNPSLSAVNEEN